jgi:hypothetical protein
MGSITVKYGGSASLPSKAGASAVTADAAAGTNFRDAGGLALGTLTIRQRKIAISAVAIAPKVYDGLRSAAVAEVKFGAVAGEAASGPVNGEALNLGNEIGDTIFYQVPCDQNKVEQLDLSYEASEGVSASFSVWADAVAGGRAAGAGVVASGPGSEPQLDMTRAGSRVISVDLTADSNNGNGNGNSGGSGSGGDGDSAGEKVRARRGGQRAHKAPPRGEQQPRHQQARPKVLHHQLPVKELELFDGDDDPYTKLYLLNAQGRPVFTGNVSALRSGLTMPETPGVYHLVIESKASRKVVKVAVGQGCISNCRFCSFRRTESLGRKGNVPVVVGIP